MTDVFIRLEPRSRGSTLEPGLSARLADPAWTLARQWVLGEFDGEDAGAPVLARAEIAHHLMSQLAVDNVDTDYDPHNQPIDPLVETVSIPPAKWRFDERVMHGKSLFHALQTADFEAQAIQLLREFPLARVAAPLAKADPAVSALSSIACGRVPDGLAVFKALETSPGGFGWPSVPAKILLDWQKAIIASDRPRAWDAPSLRYEFALRSPASGLRLDAPEHRGHDLDWYSFRHGSVAPSIAAPRIQSIARVPTSIRFAGMPNPRYWTFEDGEVDLGAVTAEAADLARMALLQFAFVYGNDAFMLPVEMPVGSLTQVGRLSVEDTFGSEFEVRPANRTPAPGRGGWSFLALSNADPTMVGSLLLPAVSVGALRGDPVEEASFMRDEMANMVWAVETRVLGEGGRSIDRAEALMRNRVTSDDPPVEAPMRYVMQADIPTNWYPMDLEVGIRRILRLATLAPAPVDPEGRLVPQVGGILNEEEIPREGVRLLRRYMMSRAPSGRTHLWSRIERHIGRPESHSGLSFDSVERQQ